MKKNVLILTAVAAIMFALTGCQRETPATAEEHPEKVTLRFENIQNPKTRLDVNGTTGAGTWSAGDRIAVYISGSGANFYQIAPLESIVGNEGHAEVYLAGGQIRDNYAIYPAEAAVQGHGASADDLYIRYPDSYDFLNMTIAEMATYTPSPMVAVNTDHQDLHFYHVGGVLRLTVPNVPMAVTQLRIVFPDDIQYTGTFKVNIPATGLEDATLTPVDGGESDDHGHVITVKLPVSEIPSANLTFNIPIPNGSVSPMARDYRVEVFSGNILIAGTGETMNWWEFQRAEGRQVALPALEGFGTMAGRYIARETYLARTGDCTTSALSPTDYASLYLATADDLEPVSFYGMADGRKIYFNHGDLAKIFGGSSDANFVNKTISFDDVQYSVPTNNDWNYIINGPRYGATVNGMPGVRFAKIKVNDAPLSGVRINAASIFYNIDVPGILLFPDFGNFTIEGLTIFDTQDAGFDLTISYVEMRKLCSGETGCVFLPCTGYMNGNYTDGAKFESGISGGFFRNSTTGSYTLKLSSTGVYTEYLPGQHFAPVRLLRVQ